MFQSYFGDIKNSIAYCSSEQLKQLLNDDEILEKRITDLVRVIFIYMTNITYNFEINFAPS